MADCLTLLRQYNIQKKEIVERDDLIVFDQIAWPKNAKTNYAIYRTGMGSTPREYYTLDSLLFLLKNVSLSHPMYVSRAGSQNIPVIKFPDRRGLLTYLNGETETTPSIDKSVHLEMGIPAPAPKRPSEEGHVEAIKKPRMETDDVQAMQKRLAKKFNKREEAITDQIYSISDALSVEKIAAIKAKILAKKRGTIKADDDLAADRLFVDDATKDIMSKERLHRTRLTVLQSSGKSFSNIFSLLQTVKARDEGRGEAAPTTADAKPEGDPPKPPRPPPHPPAQGYNRYGQEQFKGKEETGDFKIEKTGTFLGMTLQSMTESAAKLRPQVQPERTGPLQKTAENNKGKEVAKPARKDHRSRTPIIIVPAAASSAITMYNVRDFLEEYKFVLSDQKRKSGAKRQNETVINRKKPHPLQPGQTISVPYRVTDNPLRFSQQDWGQVVAVFVAGPAWQFKGWPGLSSDGSPVDIFSKVKGFHVKFDEVKLDGNIQKWDVQLLNISKAKRHLDKASILKFWDTLDKFILKHNADLRY